MSEIFIYTIGLLFIAAYFAATWRVHVILWGALLCMGWNYTLQGVAKCVRCSSNVFIKIIGKVVCLFRKHDNEIVYYYMNKKYVVLPQKFIGLRSISNISTNEVDRDEKIRQWLGPHRNFHGIETTPKMMGLNSVTVTYANGMEITFVDDEPIKIRPISQ